METVLGARQEVEASEGDFEGVVRDPKVGERVAHRELDCCRSSRGCLGNFDDTKGLMTSGVSMRTLSDGDEKSMHTSQISPGSNP